MLFYNLRNKLKLPSSFEMDKQCGMEGVLDLQIN
jgi:hypothetical protein